MTMEGGNDAVTIRDGMRGGGTSVTIGDGVRSGYCYDSRWGRGERAKLEGLLCKSANVSPENTHTHARTK